jgi:hypothetical protein
MHIDVVVFYNEGDIPEMIIDKEVEVSIDYFDPEYYSEYSTADAAMDEIVAKSYMLLTYNDLINYEHVGEETYKRMAESFKQRFSKCRVYDAHI